MQVSDYNPAFNMMHLVFLELDTYPCYFYLNSLMKKKTIVLSEVLYNNKTSKIYPDLNPAEPTQQEINPQSYRLANICKVEAYILDKISKREKNEMLTYYFKCFWH